MLPPHWTPDNTLLSLTKYIYALNLPLRQQSMALAIANRVFWDDCPRGKAGEGCYAGLATLAHDAKLGLRVASKTLAALVKAKIIGRRRTLTGNSVTQIFEKVTESPTTIPAPVCGNVPAPVCTYVPAPVDATNPPNVTSPNETNNPPPPPPPEGNGEKKINSSPTPGKEVIRTGHGPRKKPDFIKHKVK